MDEIICGDAIEVLKTLESESVQTCVTSPPYFGLRDYGHQGQIGLEETPEAYVQKMVEVFRGVRRVLKKDGTLWLNLGDSYTGSGKGRNGDGSSHVDPNSKQATSKGTTEGTLVKTATPHLKPKDLIGIPWRVAFALQTDGWYLRQDIIWAKPNPMPESVTDRCTKAHEYIFLLSKSATYYFDNEAIKEDSLTDDPRRPYGSQGAWELDGRPEEQRGGGKSRKAFDASQGDGGNGFAGHSGNMKADGTFYAKRNKRSVWTITTKPYSGAHFATFPPDLIEPCILAGSGAGGTVLDPFMGSGTTALVAHNLGRHYLGIELNPVYVEMAQERLSSLTKSLLLV